MKPSHWIDLAAIVSFTALAIAGVLPAAIVASALTMILAARFRGPVDDPTPPPEAPGGAPRGELRSGLQSEESEGTIVRLVRMGWAALQRAWHARGSHA